MASTGMLRGIDKAGRVVLPRELRETLDIQNNDSLEIFVDENTIILKKYNYNCTFCGEGKKVINYKGKYICKECINEMISYLFK